jgi:acyl-CoA reductase-like NAD-dependent aldehyde dehydrogenase
MTRPHAERSAAVWRLVEAARAVARGEESARAQLAADLVASTGLSREGVELAFARHLELDPSEADVDALVSSAGAAKHVVVILSANVFVAALRAIAIACAASPSVVVRPSRREPHFARALVAEAVRSGMTGLTLEDEVDVGRLFGGEVHVYGRDATIAAVRARVGERMRVRGHGAGMGLAVVSARASLDEAATALADDVIAFDQRGCLSPRVALVEGEERAATFARALDATLVDAARRVPRGELAPDERAEAARYKATMAFAGDVISRPSHTVALAPLGAPLTIPPTGRHLHIAPVRSLDEARAYVAELAPVIVTIGADDPAVAIAVAAPHAGHARLSLLGAMQRPPLDGPVDRR